ncbi:hypothetical protein WHR41_02048 [Cladosporium halotolerans]|uniref:Ribonuclease H2 subunit B n=1 Tax=Cladosporium halotolerans TaxID=1052096 RepID=A0AB34KWL4_9PEZI
MKTRSRKPTKATPSKTEETEPKNSTRDLAPSVDKPPHVFILPKDASAEARILSLPSVTSSLTRFFVCPQKGFYEFTKIAAPKKACRSWLLAPRRLGETQAQSEPADAGESEQDQGYLLGKPDLFVATPVDPLFILLPLLAEADSGSYLTFSDYLYTTEGEGLGQLQQLLRQSTFNSLEETMERRMQAVCDCLDMGDGEDKMYQLSVPKLAAELASKARKMVQKGLPETMEERFVKQALEMPVLSIKREDSSVSVAADDAAPEAESAATSQETSASVDSSAAVSTTSTALTTPTESQSDTVDNVAELLRIRTAMNFITISYIPATVRSRLQEALSSPTSPVNFEPLDKHLDQVASVKKQAQALRSLSDNISRKRSADDDEDALEKAEAKRKKKEEDEIRKKNTSRGVQQLAKANTSGMKKLSSFFTKAPPKKT